MLGTLLRTALKLAIALVLFLGTLEVYLTYWPETLPPRLGNYAYSKYGSFPGGMYFYDAASNMNFLKRNFETEAYFNGYRWHHRTDSLGFRDPPDLATRDVLLLGDSLIYGHGVEERSTVADRLRTEHGVAAYNMARQGDCLYQSYVLLRLYADELQPTAVVLFVFLNDFADVMTYRSTAEMIERPEAEWDYDAMRARLDVLAHRRRLEPRLLLGLKSVRLLRGVWKHLAGLDLVASAEAAPLDGPGAAPAAGSLDDDLSYLDPLLDPAWFSRIGAWYEVTLRDLSTRLGRGGVRLYVVDLDVGLDLGPRWKQAADRLADFLAGTCRRLDLHCGSTRPLFAGCDECFLPGDGHLSPEGHRRLASWTAALLTGPETRPRPGDGGEDFPPAAQPPD